MNLPSLALVSDGVDSWRRTSLGLKLQKKGRRRRFSGPQRRPEAGGGREKMRRWRGEDEELAAGEELSRERGRQEEARWSPGHL